MEINLKNIIKLNNLFKIKLQTQKKTFFKKNIQQCKYLITCELFSIFKLLDINYMHFQKIEKTIKKLI